MEEDQLGDAPTSKGQANPPHMDDKDTNHKFIGGPQAKWGGGRNHLENEFNMVREVEEEGKVDVEDEEVRGARRRGKYMRRKSFQKNKNL